MSNSEILILGDLCPDNDYRALFDSRPEGPFSPALAGWLGSAAMTLVNLECPATDNTEPIVKCGPNLRALPRDVALLRRLGTDVLSLANNHILDYGVSGLEQTLAVCREQGIVTVGAGRNAQAAAEPAILEAAGKRIGVLSFAEAEFNLASADAGGANHYDPYTSLDDVSRLSGETDFVIVLYHGGIEHYKYPSPLLQKKCRALAKAGASLVLCQHSHCIGTVERFGDSTILYGQGNAVFGYRENAPQWNEGLAVVLDAETGEVSFRLLTATAEGVAPADKAAETERLAQLQADSERLSDPDWLAAEWKRFCAKQAALDLPLLYGRGRVFTKLNRITGNALFQRLVSPKKRRITMNLLRCEAHHEVLQTILEEDFRSNNPTLRGSME